MKLGGLQDVLHDWDRNEFGSVRKVMKRLRSHLEILRHHSLRSGPMREERDIKRRLAELLAHEEAMEKQRSRVDSCMKETGTQASFRLRQDNELR